MVFLLGDYLLLGIVIIVVLVFSQRWKPKSTQTTQKAATVPDKKEFDPSRDIVRVMDLDERDCCVFFGSQTGTAEDLALRLAQEAKTRFGLNSMVADLDEYDYENLGSLPEGKILIFILATYGEGEPTDNAVDFHKFITSGELSNIDGLPPLQNVNFAAFGLGNKTYEKYNWMVRTVNQALIDLGANRLGEVGEGDDGEGSTEEDFLAWKEVTWARMSKAFVLQEQSTGYQPSFQLIDRNDLSRSSSNVFLGEPNSISLTNTLQGPFTSHNPYPAPVSASSELFSEEERNCLHIEIELSGSGLSYTTGDHIAVWPNNSSGEVDSLLVILGLSEKRHQVIEVQAVDQTAKLSFPSPTTIDAIFRYYLEICGPISRQSCAKLAQFAPSSDARNKMNAVGQDKIAFQEATKSSFHSLSSFLSWVSNGEIWKDVPFSAIIEVLTKLQPRYYSISSSSLVQPNRVSITAVVESKLIQSRKKHFKGVATNYLLSLKQAHNGEAIHDGSGSPFQLYGPRSNRTDIKLPIHIRHSTFRLPVNSSVPIIMVGPGTGVAPFRGFVQERARQAAQGKIVGPTMLFFGCRDSTKDMIYKTEWEAHKDSLGESFQLITAFSREGPKKVYVQHRLKEYGREVSKFIKQGAHIYVCGDAASMATEVNATLAQVISEGHNISLPEAEKFIKDMKTKQQYQEDVW